MTNYWLEQIEGNTFCLRNDLTLQALSERRPQEKKHVLVLTGEICFALHRSLHPWVWTKTAWQTSSQKANTINEKQKCEHANPQKDGCEGGQESWTERKTINP